MPRLRIFLVDDHEAVRTGLRVILNAHSEMEVVGEAADGRTALEAIPTLRPDVIVMDVSMPHMNGVKATEALVQRHAAVKVLALTRHADPGYVQQLLKAGASGYVLKQSRTEEVLRAIQAIVRGGVYLDPAITESALETHVGRARSASSTGPSLSSRETQVLRLIAWGHSNKDIAGTLDLSVKTVETHKTNAMRKLGMRTRIQVVRYAVLQGWLEET